MNYSPIRTEDEVHYVRESHSFSPALLKFFSCCKALGMRVGGTGRRATANVGASELSGFKLEVGTVLSFAEATYVVTSLPLVG